MPETRHIAAALAGAFIIGTVAGGVLLSGGDSTAGSTIPFNPASEESVESSTATAAKKADKADKADRATSGAFTAEAVDEGTRTVISGEGAEPGASLVVQRKESGGWQDFPARATASRDGSYSTYIITSRDGTFRLKDTNSDAASEPVDVKR